jgi:hypothetical protein
MKLNDAWQAVRAIGKGMLTQTIQNVPWIGATYAIARRTAVRAFQRDEETCRTYLNQLSE